MQPIHDQKLEGTISLGGFKQDVGGFATSMKYFRSIDIPRNFNAKDIRRAQRDCEILASKFRDHPKEMAALLEAIAGDDLQQAKHIGKNLGLAEQDFADQGGGLMWIIVVVVLLYATNAY